MVRDQELKLEDDKDSRTLITRYPDSWAESPFQARKGPQRHRLPARGQEEDWRILGLALQRELVEVGVSCWHVPEIGAAGCLCASVSARGSRYSSREVVTVFLRVLGVLAFVCVFVFLCLLCLSLRALGLFSRFFFPMSFVCLGL